MIVGGCRSNISEMNINDIYNSSYNSDGYIIYKGNKSAVKTVEKLIHENTNQKKPPIFITGVTASGKTRLLRELYNACYTEGITVCVTTAKDIANDIVESIRNKTNYKKRIVDKCIQYDLLLIDDLQDFFSKKDTLYEISNLISEMSARNKHVVCSIKIPCSFLKEAMVAIMGTNRPIKVEEIYLPRYSERIKIIKYKAFQINDKKGIFLNKKVIRYLASSCCDIARIEGAFKAVLLHLDYYKRNIDVSQIKQMIKL